MNDNIAEPVDLSKGAKDIIHEFDLMKKQVSEFDQQRLEAEQSQNDAAADHDIPQKGKSRSFTTKLNHYYKDEIKANMFTIFLYIYFAGVCLSIVGRLIQFVKAFYYVDWRFFTYSPMVLVYIILPFVFFIISTAYSNMSYRHKKLAILFISMLNAILYAETIVFRMFYCIAVPLITHMPIVRGITVGMLVLLGRIIVTVPTTVLGVFLCVWFYKLIMDEITLQEILAFKVTNHVDTRKDRKYKYDVKTVRYLSNGRQFVVREGDRFLHQLLTGTSGTGKTSMAMTTKITDDLDTRVLNEDTKKRELYKALENGKISLTGPIDNANIDWSNFKANEGFEKQFDSIMNRYRLAGITVVAPNEGLTDEIYDLATKRGITVNRLDPVPIPGTETVKEGCKGFNPLFISPLIKGFQRDIEIVKKATLFADVLQSINDMKGKSDQYFQSVNRSITTSFTILLEVTYELVHPGLQPTPEDVQLLINDFKEVIPYYTRLKEVDKTDQYKTIKVFIETDILGPGGEKMFDQSRGLRNIINDFLRNPLYKNILCTQDSIDMDKMLSEGQVTVVNYALQLGDTDSTAFGLFFLLSFIDAVLRRPGTADTRIPHFWDIDELPVLLTPAIERTFALFRQYRTGMCVALQSLDQLDKTDMTKYLKGVILGNCATQIVYGRCSASEMDIYSKLAGTEITLDEQTSISETSLSLENTSLSYSSRMSATESNVISESQIRNRNFQEVTVFSIVNGSVIKPFIGKMDFLKKSKKREVERYNPDWSKFYTDFKAEPTPTKAASIAKKGLYLTSNGIINNLPVTETQRVVLEDGIEPEKILQEEAIQVAEPTISESDGVDF